MKQQENRRARRRPATRHQDGPRSKELVDSGRRRRSGESLHSGAILAAEVRAEPCDVVPSFLIRSGYCLSPVVDDYSAGDFTPGPRTYFRHILGPTVELSNPSV